MNIVIFSPFGAGSQETGLLGLLANYLKNIFPQVCALRCNGIFSLCDRDGENGWRRGIQGCFSCMQEQERLSAWAGIRQEDLSLYLEPEEVVATKRWVLGLSAEEIPHSSFQGFVPYGLCVDSLRAYFGVETPDLSNEAHGPPLRRMLISALRMILVSDRFVRANKPNLALVAGGRDFISAAFIERARAGGVDVAEFCWDLASRSIKILHPRSRKEFPCPLVFEDITTMRSDSRTWPWELVRILEDILVFLDLTSSQLALPIAR